MMTTKQTHTHKVGNGKPLYVVNGGPGLEYSYFKDFFMPLTQKREIIFYDQIGTGQDFDLSIQVTAQDLTQQLINLLRADERRKDIVAHSWGTYLALSALADQDVNLSVDKVILINPFALDYARYEGSGQRLLSRFPQEVLGSVGKLAQENTKESYLQMMLLIAPYYTQHPERGYSFKFESYNSPMEDGVYGSISGFNHVPVVSQINGDLYVIKCDDDFISLDDTKELQSRAKQSVILSNCGHFPFCEKQEECYKQFEEFLESE